MEMFITIQVDLTTGQGETFNLRCVVPNKNAGGNPRYINKELAKLAYPALQKLFASVEGVFPNQITDTK